MVLTARYCIQQVIKQNQDYWKRMAVEMSNIVRSAQRIKETGGNIGPPPMPRGNFNPPPYDNRSRSAAHHNGPQPSYGSYDNDPYANRPPPRNNYNLY